MFGGLRALEGGYYLARSRILDPEMGLWLSPDPRGYRDSPSLYAYARQDPINLIDPTGEAVPLIIAVLVIGGALVGAGYSIYDCYHHPEKYDGYMGALRAFGYTVGGAAFAGVGAYIGEGVLALAGTGALVAEGSAATLTLGQTFLAYGLSAGLGGAVTRAGFHAMFPEYIDPVSKTTVATDFVLGGSLSVVGKVARPYAGQLWQNARQLAQITRESINDGSLARGAGEMWRRAIDGNWRVFGNNWELLRRAYFGSSRTQYGLRNLISDPRPFQYVSSQYWRVSDGANGKALHHWLFQNQNRLIPQSIRNAAFNHLEIPSGLNTWMGGRLGREWAFRGVVSGILGVTGAVSAGVTSATIDALENRGRNDQDRETHPNDLMKSK